MTVHSSVGHRAHQSTRWKWTALGFAALAILILTFFGGFAIYTWGWNKHSVLVTRERGATQPGQTGPTVTDAGGGSASGIPLKHPGTLAVSGWWLKGLLDPPSRPGGKVTGFDADLVDRIAAYYAVPRVQWIDSRRTQPAVQKRADLAVDNLVDESSSRYRYSTPFLADNLGLLVRTGSKAAAAQTLSAVAKLKIGVPNAFTAAYVAATARPEAAPQVFSTHDEAVSALKNGEVDAVFMFLPVGSSYPGKGLEFTAQVPTGLLYAFQVPVDSPILPAVNRALNEMRASGTLRRLVKKWFPKTFDLPALRG
jgi:ABC-type amino acid transport substrate-binding protein